jgi:hypothetical protein
MTHSVWGRIRIQRTDGSALADEGRPGSSQPSQRPTGSDERFKS